MFSHVHVAKVLRVTNQTKKKKKLSTTTTTHNKIMMEDPFSTNEDDQTASKTRNGSDNNGISEPKADQNSPGVSDQGEDSKEEDGASSTVRLSFGKRKTDAVSPKSEDDDEEELGQVKPPTKTDDESEEEEEEGSLLLQFNNNNKKTKTPSSAKPEKPARKIETPPVKPAWLVKFLASRDEPEQPKKKKKETTPEEDFEKFGIVPEPDAPVFEYRIFQNMSQLFNTYKTGKTFVKTNTVDKDMLRCQEEYAEYMKYWDDYCSWVSRNFPNAYKILVLKKTPMKASGADTDETADTPAAAAPAPKARKPRAKKEDTEPKTQPKKKTALGKMIAKVAAKNKKATQQDGEEESDQDKKRIKTVDYEAVKGHWEHVKDFRRKEESHYDQMMELLLCNNE
jgi:hypothetical protein